MANVLTSELIVKLKDMVSGPSRKVAESMKRMQDAQAKHSAHMTELKGKFIGAGAGVAAFAFALKAPIQSSMEFSSKLEDIRQKGGLAKAQMDAIGKTMAKIGEATGQSAMSVAETMDSLMGLGATKDEATGLLDTVSKTATAFGANTTEVGAALYSVINNLKLPIDQVATTMDGMAFAANAGAFELKDMAQYFPTLAAGYAAYGQKGKGAAIEIASALQVVRGATGDSASAATNLGNLFQKMAAPATVKAFGKMGVNLSKSMKQAAADGKSPLEGIIEATMKATKGDMSKLGYLFQDAQVQGALRPLIADFEKLKKIKADAMANKGFVQDNFEGRMETPMQKMIAFQHRMENLGRAIGDALIPALTAIVDKIGPMVSAMTDFVQAHPQVVTAAVAIAGGLMTARFAALGLRLAFGGMNGLALSAASGLLKMAPAALGLLNPLNIVKTAMLGLRVALMSTGIGAIVIGVAAAGTAIYNNWDGITAMFSGFATAISAKFPIVGKVIDGISTGVSTLVGWFGEMTGPIDMTAQQWTQLGIKIANVISDAVSYVAALPGRIAGALAELPAAFTNAASAAGTALLNGLAAAMQAALDYVTNMASNIASAVTGAFTGGGVQYAGASGQMPGIQGGYTPPKIDGARARGGSVAGGKTYLVGERGPELFSPVRSGNITPNNRLGGKSGGVTIGSIVIHSAGNADDIARQIGAKLKSAINGLHGDIEYAHGM